MCSLFLLVLFFLCRFFVDLCFLVSVLVSRDPRSEDETEPSHHIARLHLSYYSYGYGFSNQ